MNTRILIFALLCFLCIKSKAQNILKDNAIGLSLTMHSKILNDERALEIFLPDGYADSEIEYPVLYILDGQRYFLHGVSLQKSFVEFKQTSEFIIVGVSKNPSDRNRNYSVNSHQYLEHLKKEVINYIDTDFRTTKTRMLFGWAYAGGFVIETLTKEPDLFDVYIAASPFPVEEKINKVDSLFKENPNFDKLLYFTSGTNEGVVKKGTAELNTLLTNKAPKTINWTYKELEGEEHRSTPFTTLYHGITAYFDYYPELQFNTLAEFSKAGGLSYVYDYYKKRATRFEFPNELSDWTMFSLTRNAIRANDYEQFDLMFTKFEKTGFISRLTLNRASSIAAFCLDNKQYDKAINLYTLLIEKHPSSEIPLNGLGDVYTALQKNRKASRYFRMAKKLSESVSD
ncbi:alpha/beta hydrolase-fold protein [Maribacter algarum]|nr:alpha/beta hydrolase-fold protein [Maribacter algarum]